MIDSVTKLETIVNLLADNKDSWELDDNSIMFKDQTLLNEYNSLCAEL